jgi:hypothetical protein
MNIKLLSPIHVLLTSSVGGTDTNWRNKLLGKAILAFEKIKEPDSQAKFSHAELLLSELGHTFGARWRTREREPAKGLLAYDGAYIMIAEPIGVPWSDNISIYGKVKALFDGDIYPVHRLLLQGLSAVVFPWIVKLGAGGIGVCSEVVAAYLMHAKLRSYWRGTTPAMLEDEIRNSPSKYKIKFEGVFDAKSFIF